MPTAMVFAPAPLLTVTVERKGHGDDIHVHAGGQGFWIARMLAELGIDTVFCGTFGGETGLVVRSLIEQAGIRVRAVPMEASNVGYVHDRRSGTREHLADMDPPSLSRHETDELYGAALVEGLDAAVCVLSGSPPEVLPSETYRRLARDLRVNGAVVVADLSGAQLLATLEDRVTVLKVSHTELIDAGFARSDSYEELAAALFALRNHGAETVVVSRADEPALVLYEDDVFEVYTPRLEPLDHRGAGDSMTAGIAAGLARGRTVYDAVRIGAAAGALNVTRHGLASGNRDTIEQFAAHIEFRTMADTSGARDSSPSGATTPEALAARARPEQ